MSIFRFLPKVKTCCFIVNLIDGCYFAGIYGIFSILDFTFGLLSNQSDDCWGHNSTMPLVIQYYGYFMTVLCILVGVVSVIFIWGLRKTKSYTAVWFMYAMTFKSIALLVFSILLIVANLKYLAHDEQAQIMNCEFPLFTISFSFIFTFVHSYLVIVVRSYHVVMVKDEEEQAAAAAVAAAAAAAPKLSTPKLVSTGRTASDVTPTRKSIMKQTHQQQQC